MLDGIIPRMTERREISIGFGDIFLSTDETAQTLVVLDVGEGNNFVVAPLVEYEGSKRLGFLGDSGPERIDKMIGQMSKDKVVEAAENMARLQGGELSTKSRDLFDQYSQKERRIITVT
jgi:hypothetical protein